MFKFGTWYKLLQNANKIFMNSHKQIVYSATRNIAFCNCKSNTSRILTLPISNHRTQNPLKVCLALNILSWLGFIDDDEKKESELIMTLKRAILATNREQFDKAEQLLHIALRLAQQQQNEQGITYCYDLMANLAFNRYELDKSEKLFVSVLQRLLSSGVQQDDLKVIHISLKLARICHLKGEDEKADIGYNWCLEKIDKGTGVDARMLRGVIHDWYAQFLLDKKDIVNSLKHLKEAYSICFEIKGAASEQSMLLLNDLGITYWRSGNMDNAVDCLNQAVEIGNKLEDKSHVGVVNANLGLIYLQKGVIEQAEKYCKSALYLGNRHENEESVLQANYCIEQIKMSTSK